MNKEDRSISRDQEPQEEIPSLDYFVEAARTRFYSTESFTYTTKNTLTNEERVHTEIYDSLTSATDTIKEYLQSHPQSDIFQLLKKFVHDTSISPDEIGAIRDAYLYEWGEIVRFTIEEIVEKEMMKRYPDVYEEDTRRELEAMKAFRQEEGLDS